MKNVTGKRETVTDNAKFMENSNQIFERLIQTTVSEALIADAIDLYAEQEIKDVAARDEFVDKYADAVFEPIIKKAVLDVVVAVVAAHTVENDETFKSIVDKLEVEEKDDDIRSMKIFMLRKMTDDAASDLADPIKEQVFCRRMTLMEAAIG